MVSVRGMKNFREKKVFHFFFLFIVCILVEAKRRVVVGYVDICMGGRVQVCKLV